MRPLPRPSKHRCPEDKAARANGAFWWVVRFISFPNWGRDTDLIWSARCASSPPTTFRAASRYDNVAAMMTQANALKILKTGANVFLTGEPGSGKTYTI